MHELHKRQISAREGLRSAMNDKIDKLSDPSGAPFRDSQLGEGSIRDDVQARAMRRRFRKGVFIVPSLLTTGNIFCGFYSVMESMAGSKLLSVGDAAGATTHFDNAAINIGVAALFDFLDGRIARMTGATSEFGVELDSIADVLSFGIAPAVLAYAWGYGNLAGSSPVPWAVSFLFLVCGALRLARFNVQARQPNLNLPPRQPKTEKKAFVGMPIPAGASLIAAIVHFSPGPVHLSNGIPFSFLGHEIIINGRFYCIALIVLVACLAFLMVSTVRYTSFKGVSTQNYHPRVLILLMALLVLSIWFYSRWSLLIISTLYASHGVIGKIFSILKPHHDVTSQTPDVHDH